MRKRTKRPIKKRKTTRKTFAKRVKSVVMKVSETKKCQRSFAKIEMFHNVFSNTQCYHLNSASNMPSGGSSTFARVGDRMNSIGWKIKLLIGQKGDRPNVNFRWMAFSIPKGGTLDYASVFENVTNNIMLDDPNRDTTRVLASGYMRPNQAGLAATGNDEYTFTKRLFIPHKKLYKFGPADGANTHNQHDVYFTIMCYDAFGSLLTDNIAYFQGYTELMFKDI
jgi:hypothetical protein